MSKSDDENQPSFGRERRAGLSGKDNFLRVKEDEKKKKGGIFGFLNRKNKAKESEQKAMLAFDEDADEEAGNGDDGALKLPDMINHQMEEPLKLRACFIPLMVIHCVFIATNIWFY